MIISLEALKERRLKLGLTQGDMAKKLELSNAGHYSKLERGEYKIKAELLPALAKALKCKITNFFM